MLSITQLQPGVTILWNNQPFQVLKSDHVQMGRGGGIQRVRIKNLRDGTTVDQTFKGNQMVPEATLQKRVLQYLYTNADQAIFMDPKTFDQHELPIARISSQMKYLKEGETIETRWFNDEFISIQLPIKMTLLVIQTEPGLRGDRQTAGTKPATVETGATLQVPLFIDIGDPIVIDTRTDTYIERAKPTT